MERGWTWDATLYAGSAAHYATGLVPYPPQLVPALVDALKLDGTGQLLDVGCGPGSLTLLLAPHAAQAIGVDADSNMLAEAERPARQQHLTNTTWRHLRAEDLPPVDLVIFAQSFHCMDRRRVAAAARGLLAPGGARVHVHATTHQAIDGDLEEVTGADEPVLARPPWGAITELVRSYLGPQPRAQQSVLPGCASGGEVVVYRAAGSTGPRRLSVPGRRIERTVEQSSPPSTPCPGLCTSPLRRSPSTPSTPTCAACWPPPAVTATSASRGHHRRRRLALI